MIQKYTLLTILFASAWYKPAQSQILIPEDLPVTGEVVFMKTKLNKLWVVQSLPVVGSVHTFSVSIKSGNQWERLSSLFLTTQQNSKSIRITDIEFLGNRIYLSGDFALFQKGKNCLIYTETGAKEWFGDHLFTAPNQNPPVVHGLSALDNKMYIGGSFNKINNTECLNLAVHDKLGNVSGMRFYNNIGANGVVTGIENDSTNTSLFIGGAFKSIFGKAFKGLVQFKPSDSTIKNFTSDPLVVFSMSMEGSRLLMYCQNDSTKPRKITSLNKGALKDALGIDSLYEITSLFSHKGQLMFSGVALLSSSNRESGIFAIYDGAKTARLYAKFNKIWMAESFGDHIYVVGSFLNAYSNVNEGYGLARIDDNFKRFYGRVFHDKGGDGKYNHGIDTRVGNRDVRVMPYGLLIPVDRSGYFTFVIPKGKNQLITASIAKTADLINGYTYQFNADTFNERLIDFPLKFLKDNFSNVNVHVSAAAGWKCRKDTSELYVIKISNNGLTTVQPDIKLNFNGKIILIKPFPAPDIIDPGKLTWSKQTLLPGDEKTFMVKLTTPAVDFTDNQEIEFNASVSGAPDDLPEDNTDTLFQTVSSGVSPNAKYQYPEATVGDSIAFLDPSAGKIDYIIRFSNNTNDTISTVVVRDTIATPDYVTYIQETGSSHTFSRYVYTTPSLPDKVIVAYTFNNIKLPPNPSGNTEVVNSSGYVGFQLGLKTNLNGSTDLRNRASIYMDNYAPIHTNTVVAKVKTSGLLTIKNIGSLLAYPNPMQDQLMFNKDMSGCEFKFYGIQGNFLFNEQISNNTISINNHDIGPGSYLWTVISKDGIVNKGIVLKN